MGLVVANLSGHPLALNHKATNILLQVSLLDSVWNECKSAYLLEKKVLYLQ
jgi:hypothetical protein